MSAEWTGQGTSQALDVLRGSVGGRVTVSIDGAGGPRGVAIMHGTLNQRPASNDRGGEDLPRVRRNTRGAVHGAPR